MRKYHQVLLLELLQTVDEANAEIKSLLNKQDNSTLINLLADCQEVAIQMGNLIEELAGKGTKTVAQLEEYCHLLYLVSTETIEGGGKGIVRQLQQQAGEIRKKILTELPPDRYEIVFMPYNASMWDSMESIWQAAKDDPQCDAYVVPLPYYNRNADKQAEELCYDGDKFPEYLSVIHFDMYELDARKPDVIYIHNPYDQYNYVTSIHPRYYSDELKKSTDMLVYVPYFVTDGTISDDFVAVRAVKYADRIIVQSEGVRKSYLKYVKADRVAALGSPKIDKIVHAKKQEYSLSASWQERIAGRKVVFYNTNLFNIIRGDSYLLAKLRDVIAVFAERDDVALWWRPHPLSKDTIKSMHPDIWKEYNDIITGFKEAGHGIYDETGDLHQALACSDAYYGDYSSVASMYRVTGKPILFQNTNFTRADIEGDEFGLAVQDLVVQGHDVWLISMFPNYLYHLDLKTQKLERVLDIRERESYEFLLTDSVSLYGDEVIIAPHNGKHIIRHNISQYGQNSEYSQNSKYNQYDNGDKIPLPKSAGLEREYKFRAAYCCRQKLYFIPAYYPAILQYDPISGDMEENNKICIELDGYKDKGHEKYFGRGAVINEETLMLPCGVANLVVKYHTGTDKYTFYRVGDAENKYEYLVRVGEDYWLFPLKGNIVKWNERTGKTKVLDHFPEGYQHGKNVDYVDPVVAGEHILVFPGQSNMILKINVVSDQITCFRKLGGNESGHKKSTNKYTCARLRDDAVYAYSYYENVLQVIDVRAESLKAIPLMISADDYKEAMDRPLLWDPHEDRAKSFRYEENIVLTLKLFLERLVTEKADYSTVPSDIADIFANADGSCGVRIHEYIKKELGY